MPVTSSKIDQRRYWRSSSFKMALLFTLLLGGCVLVLGYFTYYFNRDNFILGADNVIDTEIAYLSRSNQLLVDLPMQHRSDRVYMLRDSTGAIIGGTLTKIPENATVLKEGTIIFHDHDRLYAAKIHMFEDGRSLLAGMDVTAAARSYRLMQWLSVLSIGFMAVVILVSFFISTFVVSRTNRIAMTAKHIMDTGDLSRRIVIDSRWDDLGNMAFVLNALLERIEHLMAGIRQVSDNIAHDLKTPLTRLYNQLEQLKLKSSGTGNAEITALTDGMTGEAGRLLDTFNALLRIAHIENDKRRQNFKPVDLQKILQDVVELYEPLAQEKRIRLIGDLDAVSSYSGDRDLLFQAFVNIVDNAIKFTPLDGAISVSLRTRGDYTIVAIEDSGPGIGAADKPKVFDRFYRAESSRNSAGNGLGLALVAAVMGLHDAAISLHDVSPGLRIEMLL